MIKLVISGCCGRMGSRITTLASQDEEIEITGAIEKDDNPKIGKELAEVLGIDSLKVKISSDLEKAIRGGDVLVEFTTPEATMEHLEIALSNKKAMVIGTTGIEEAGVRRIHEASNEIPIVFSPNMSVGVNLLFKLVKESVAVLKDFAVNITEAHHKHKKDAPSGTAKRLSQIVKGEGGQISQPIKSIREGEIIGDHTVVFDGIFETLQLSHHAKSRDVFAKGALEAAKFVVTKNKGLYDMSDILYQRGKK